MVIGENELEYDRWLLAELENPFSMLPVQGLANSLTQALSESPTSFTSRMSLGGIAGKYWDMPTGPMHAEIGSLIGAAFVLGQVSVSQSLAIIGRLRLHVEDEDALPKSKEALLDIDAEFDPQSGLSELVIVDSVANYVKHHHEWSPHWDEFSPASVQSKTIQNVKRLGILHLWLVICRFAGNKNICCQGDGAP